MFGASQQYTAHSVQYIELNLLNWVSKRLCAINHANFSTILSCYESTIQKCATLRIDYCQFLKILCSKAGISMQTNNILVANVQLYSGLTKANHRSSLVLYFKLGLIWNSVPLSTTCRIGIFWQHIQSRVLLWLNSMWHVGMEAQNCKVPTLESEHFVGALTMSFKISSLYDLYPVVLYVLSVRILFR